jgi:hypothetical protein
MTPDSCAQSLQNAARRADWVRCEQLGRLYGWCLLVMQLRRGFRRLAVLMLRVHTPRRVR